MRSPSLSISTFGSDHYGISFSGPNFLGSLAYRLARQRSRRAELAGGNRITGTFNISTSTSGLPAMNGVNQQDQPCEWRRVDRRPDERPGQGTAQVAAAA